jgi:aminoglycoside phosphotransferase (APT) family kinase protein
VTRLQAPGRDAADVLSSLPGMAGARVLRPLADGPTNVSYLVVHAGERFVLRLDTAETAALGLNRQNERTVCAAVAAAGLGPAYSHFVSAAGVCLRPFVAGRSLDRADLADRAILRRLATVLRSLHGLAAVGAPFAPLAAVRRYAEQLGTPGAAAPDRAAALHAGLERHLAPLVVPQRPRLRQRVAG